MSQLVNESELLPRTYVGYCRTSTDDRGQDPLRQRDIMEHWSERLAPDGRPREVIAWVVDEGTSGGTDPFQRQKVLQAIDIAERNRCDGLVVEAVDRWTREGMRKLALTEFFLDLDHKLALEVADLPPGMDEFTREIITGLMAACAKEFRRRLREQVTSGLARAKSKGWPRGRPGRKPKPCLSDREKALIRGMVFEEGKGVDKVALELSKMRGAWDATDYKRQQYLRTGPTWLWHHIHAEMPNTAAELSRRCKKPKGHRAERRRIRPARGQMRPFQSRYGRDRLASLANAVESEQSAVPR